MSEKNCSNCMNFITPEYSIFVFCKKVSRATKYKPRKTQISEDQFSKFVHEENTDCPHWVSDTLEPSVFDMDCEVQHE